MDYYIKNVKCKKCNHIDNYKNIDAIITPETFSKHEFTSVICKNCKYKISWISDQTFNNIPQ